MINVVTLLPTFFSNRPHQFVVLVLHLRYVNLTTHNTLDTRTDDAGLSISGANDEHYRDTIANNPTHLVLKLLFLDDDEVPSR